MRHAHRDAVGGEDDPHHRAAVGRKLIQRILEIGGVRFDESGVIEEEPQLVHLRCSGAGGLERPDDVFAILPAPGVATEGRGYECQGPAYSVVSHLPYRVRQVGMPVAIPQIDRQCRRVACQLPPESGHQGTILLVDRTHAAEVLIVLRHCQQPLLGTGLPRVTFSRKGSTSSGPSGPPKETTSTASYDRATSS